MLRKINIDTVKNLKTSHGLVQKPPVCENQYVMSQVHKDFDLHIRAQKLLIGGPYMVILTGFTVMKLNSMTLYTVG